MGLANLREDADAKRQKNPSSVNFVVVSKTVVMRSPSSPKSRKPINLMESLPNFFGFALSATRLGFFDFSFVYVELDKRIAIARRILNPPEAAYPLRVAASQCTRTVGLSSSDGYSSVIHPCQPLKSMVLPLSVVKVVLSLTRTQSLILKGEEGFLCSYQKPVTAITETFCGCVVEYLGFLFGSVKEEGEFVEDVAPKNDLI